MISRAGQLLLLPSLPGEGRDGDTRDATTAQGSAPTPTLPLKGREREACSRKSLVISASSPLKTCVNSSYFNSKHRATSHAH